MSISKPEILFVLLIFVPISFVYVILYRRGQSDLRNLNYFDARSNFSELYFAKFFLQAIFFAFGFAFLIISLSDIHWQKGYKSETTTVVDCVFVVDVSNSMLADDVLPSRLERVKRVINALGEANLNSRYALVAVKGSAHLCLPMTQDKHSIISAINNISPAIITTPGTALRDGLKKAISVFPSGNESTKVIFFFSDGGKEKSRFDNEIIRECLDKKIKVYTIGCGTEEGGFIRFDEQRVMLDGASKPLRVKLISSELEKLASATGGKYFDIAQPDIAYQIENILHEQEKNIGVIHNFVYQLPEYNIFLGLALFCFGLSLVCRVIKFGGIL